MIVISNTYLQEINAIIIGMKQQLTKTREYLTTTKQQVIMSSYDEKDEIQPAYNPWKPSTAYS